MRRYPRFLPFAVLVFAVAGFLGWRLLADLTPEQRQFQMALANVLSLVENGQPQPFTTTLEVLRGEGLPKQLKNARLEIAASFPERLLLKTNIESSAVAVCRNGNEIWATRADKNLAVRAISGVPTFSARPDEIDNTRLEPLALPFDTRKLLLLPALCDIEPLAGESVEGVACTVLRAKPKAAAREVLGLGAVELTLWVRPDGWPAQVAFRDGGKTDVAIALHDLKVGARPPEETWRLPAGSEAKIEVVALHHVKRFLDSAPALLKGPKIPTLGPVTGEKRLVATHGKGRLEMRDGTRVLFLSGTPEEMGAQHGVLLKEDAQRLVSHILYGVGVGSSFAKGEWFFGTIERCQARIQPFVDARYLREMDALASAAGLHPQEARLGNFFPELFHCSGFALTGAATRDGRIYHGRVLDYMKGVGLELNAVVMVVRPDQGHAWVNVGYAGFIGSVTAMNEKQISIGEMGGRGEGNWDGKPMAQLVREVMEKAGTLDEAVAIMRDSPRTCEYYYVIADGKTRRAVGIKATPEIFEVVGLGEAHPQLETPVQDTVLLSAGDRYRELVKRVQAGWGKFDADASRDLMTRPVCMTSNIQSVLFAPDTLDFWVANADSHNVASHTRYTHYNLAELLRDSPAP
jgi:hypothetical protein